MQLVTKKTSKTTKLLAMRDFMNVIVAVVSQFTSHCSCVVLPERTARETVLGLSSDLACCAWATASPGP